MNELMKAGEVLVSNQANELSTTAMQSNSVTEILGMIQVAKALPRGEMTAYTKIMHSCKRTAFAEKARYAFPRGGKQVSGASVNLAREMARAWGNIRYGMYIVRDDDKSRLIRGWAWDLETNTRVEYEDDFLKLIYRKEGGWVVPDERDLRELTFRRGAILVRNCILQLMPSDYIEDALVAVKKTLTSKAAKDPDAAKKAIAASFVELGIGSEKIEKYLGHTLDECQPAEVAELRAIYQSMLDGQSKWEDYDKKPAGEEESGLKKAAKSKKAAAVKPEQVPPQTDNQAVPILGADYVQKFNHDLTAAFNGLSENGKMKFLSDAGLETFDEYLATLRERNEKIKDAILKVFANYRTSLFE
jgi:hypothetical protein